MPTSVGTSSASLATSHPARRGASYDIRARLAGAATDRPFVRVATTSDDPDTNLARKMASSSSRDGASRPRSHLSELHGKGERRTRPEFPRAAQAGRESDRGNVVRYK